MLERFKRIIQEEFAIRTSDSKFILAVSGGLDSRTMAELFFQAKYSFSIAHVNFNLRKEAQQEQEFVAKLAAHYGCALFIKQFETAAYSNDRKISVQEAARELRYNWFEELLQQEKEKQVYLVTAHHANDNVETVLINFFRGSGIHGITGIPEKQGKIIRPLLQFKREELQNFAQINGLKWMDDSSNFSDKYTRNFYRLNVIPLIEQRNPAASENVLHNIGRFQEVEILYDEIIQIKKRKLCKEVNNEIHIPIFLLLKMAAVRTLIWEIIRDYGFSVQQTEGVLKLTAAENGSFIASNDFRIFKNRNWLVISPNECLEASNILITATDKKVNFREGKLSFRTSALTGFSLSDSKDVAWLDASKVEFPLILRRWKTGDYFYPLGLKKKKKLSRFFIDQKLSLTEKEKVWVLESNKKIIWIIGYRIDERFKITGNSKAGLRIDFIKT